MKENNEEHKPIFFEEIEHPFKDDVKKLFGDSVKPTVWQPI